MPFDVLGQSFYPWWQGSLDDLKSNLAFVWNNYRKSVVVAETAYDWRTGEDFKGKPAPFPQTPEGQRDFLAALNQVVRRRPAQASAASLVGTDGRRRTAKRDLFDDEHEALPAIHVFDSPAQAGLH